MRPNFAFCMFLHCATPAFMPSFLQKSRTAVPLSAWSVPLPLTQKNRMSPPSLPVEPAAPRAMHLQRFQLQFLHVTRPTHQAYTSGNHGASLLEPSPGALKTLSTRPSCPSTVRPLAGRPLLPQHSPLLAAMDKALLWPYKWPLGSTEKGLVCFAFPSSKKGTTS